MTNILREEVETGTSEYSLYKVVLAFALICMTVAWFHSSGMQFHYNKKNKLMTEFLEKSNISNMYYRPYFLCLGHIGASFIHVITEVPYFKVAKPFPLENELFPMPDGGTIGVGWLE